MWFLFCFVPVRKMSLGFCPRFFLPGDGIGYCSSANAGLHFLDVVALGHSGKEHIGDLGVGIGRHYENAGGDRGLSGHGALSQQGWYFVAGREMPGTRVFDKSPAGTLVSGILLSWHWGLFAGAVAGSMADLLPFPRDDDL